MILVTGGTGLVGAHLLLHLIENGETVRATYRNPISLQKTKSLFTLYQKENLFDKIEWVLADINEIPTLKKAFQDIQFVYHCAAIISFDRKKEELLRKTNIEGTANIVNFCLEHNIKKLCHVSSIAALGDLLEHETIVTEETDWNPEREHSDYAISKYGAEMEIWRGQQEGLDVTIVNPGVILGPGFWDDGSGKIFKSVAQGLPFYTKGITGFVAIDDVVVSMISLMKSDIKGERFILVGENVSYENIVKSIAANLKVKQPRIHAKKWTTEIYWRIDWLISKLFLKPQKITKSLSNSMHSFDFYSNEKIKKELQLEFTPPLEYIKKISGFYEI